MWEHSGRFLTAIGPLVHVRYRCVDLEAGEVEPPPVAGVMLIDTGADITGIDNAIPEAMGLVPLRFMPVAGVNNAPEDYPVYRMGIDISGVRHGERETVTFNAHVVGTPASAEGYSGLLGRDSPQHLKFIYDGRTSTYRLQLQAPVEDLMSSRNGPVDRKERRRKARKLDKRRRKPRR